MMVKLWLPSVPLAAVHAEHQLGYLKDVPNMRRPINESVNS